MSYTHGTFAALVDAIVPGTPALADRGEEHVPGGLDVGLEAAVVERTNRFLEGESRVPLATVVAALLDAAAVELLLRRRATDGLNAPAEAFSRGVFARLSRQDRLRALGLLEGEEGAFARIADRFDDAGLGVVRYLAGSLPVLVQFVYYSEATAAAGETRSLGWRQADYPGPAEGYPVGMGYEIEAFEENEYESEMRKDDAGESEDDAGGEHESGGSER